MPSKRRHQDFDPNKSDSDDEDFDISETRPPRSKRAKREKRKPLQKRSRHGYGGEDISDDDDDISEESLDDIEMEEEEIEQDPRTGRPVRSAAKKSVKYEESPSEVESEQEEEDDEEDEITRKSPRKTSSQVLTLKYRNSAGRSTRARSASQGLMGAGAAANTRRSSRIARDENDTIVALTGSGHHAEIIRPGTRSPDAAVGRATKGGKGLRSRGAIVAIAEENSQGASKEEALAEDSRPVSASSDVPAWQPAILRSDIEGKAAATGEKTDTQNATQGDTQPALDIEMSQSAVVPDSDEAEPEFIAGDDAEDDDDEEPISQNRRRSTRAATRVEEDAQPADETAGVESPRRSLRSRGNRSSQRPSRRGQEEGSDFDPEQEEGGEDEMSASDASASSPRKASQRTDDNDSANEELIEEARALRRDRPKRAPKETILYEENKPRRRARKSVDYRIVRPELTIPIEEVEHEASPPRKSRGGGGGGWQRSLFSTYGPFGGAGGPAPVFGGGAGATGGVESDSSDDDAQPRIRPPGGTVGMTPTSGAPPGFGTFPAPQPLGPEPQQGLSGTPANLGKVKDKQSLADADPLGVDQNVTFEGVGGLQGHIDQLKEMVSMPLLYPEIFQQFHITPPRGVLFHGPPGTGKTLLARALASSVRSGDRKVTFYMRKGADALSKWVGEAERQLRLLFEEARKNQPSIIFFDEIDGKTSSSMIYSYSSSQ